MATSTEAKPLTLDEIRALKHSFIGPTWQKNPDGSWLLPSKTLGWQIAGWCTTYLLADDGKSPWRFTDEQLRFILWWYAVDEDGEFPYRTGVFQRLKGHGKDPLAAVMSTVEFVGPSRFERWATAADVAKDPTLEVGGPKGVAHPQAWVQIAAVSREQTKNTMTLFPSLMSPLLVSTYGIKMGAELLRADGGRKRLEAVTSNFRTLEGARSTFILLNEPHHWISGNGGHDMYLTIDGNATKKDSRYLAITNAYLPGEDSVAERMREAYDKIVEGKAADVGFMYDSIEAHPSTPLTPEALEIVIPIIRGDSVWLKVKTIIKSVLNTTLAPSRSRRMWLNQIVTAEDAMYGAEHWKPLEVEGAVLKPGDEITLGFDGGKSDDATVLMALRERDQVAFVLGAWEKPDGPAGENWQVNKEEVDSAVREAFRLFTVLGFYADVALWESYISEWAKDYGEGLAVKSPGGQDAIGWDMRKSLQAVTRAHERFAQAIYDKKVFHDGDLLLSRHVRNVHRRENKYGVSFGKASAESPRKVDAYAALMLAHEALHDFRIRGKRPKKKTGRGYFL